VPYGVLVNTESALAGPSGKGVGDMNERKPAKTGSKMQFSDASPRQAALGRQIQDRIGQQLRAMYNDVMAQGIPDRFTDLLKKLDHRDDEEKS
jgi:Anti-sigma factor NepR